MANVLTRRFLMTNMMKLKDISNLKAYSCTNILLTKLNNERTSNFNHKYEFKSAVLHLPTNFNVVCYSTHSKGNNEENSLKQAEEKEEKLTLFQKFKVMYRDYWYVLVPVHVFTSTIWFGTFYYMAKSGIDIIQILESWHVSERVVNPLRDSSMGYFAVAYALYKISTPARYTVTLGGTTLSINYLKKWGYIKPVPSKERMKEIYQERKETLTKSMKHTKEEIIEEITEKKDELVESVKEKTGHLKKHKENIKEKVSKLKDKTKV